MICLTDCVGSIPDTHGNAQEGEGMFKSCKAGLPNVLNVFIVWPRTSSVTCLYETTLSEKVGRFSLSMTAQR